MSTSRDAKRISAPPPILRLTCKTWMHFDRLLVRHLLPRQMLVPALEETTPGHITVTVSLPSGDVLTFDALLTRNFRDDDGRVMAAKIQFPEISLEEARLLRRFAARRERGWEAEAPARFCTEVEPKSGVKFVEP